MPSEFNGSFFPGVHPVSVGTVIASSQQKRVAKAINARILSGLGDVHWRSLWTAYSMVRNFRLPSSAIPPLYAAEDEWMLFYGLYDETSYSWPTAAIGAAEGLNKDCPIVGYFYGSQDGTSIDSEQERKSDQVPLRDGANPAPATVLEIWDLGKDQRGAILPVDLTDYTYAYALASARIMDAENATIVTLDAKHKTPGGRINAGDVNDFWREKGQQWNQMRTYFLSEFRGTAAERNDDPTWQATELTVAYEQMLESQWFLAPAWGAATGSAGAAVAVYPLFEWDLLDPAETYGTVDATDNKSNATDFSFAGFIAAGENLAGDKSIQVELDGVVIHTFELTIAEPEESVWYPIPKTGNVKVKLLTTLTGTEDVFVEVAHLMDFKPDIIDLHLFVRLSTTRTGSPTIYRGKIISDAWELSNAYFENGMIFNGSHDEIYEESNIAKNAPYQAWRDFIIKHFRIMAYDRLKEYYVNGDGDSVLTFDRRGGVPGIFTTGLDAFQKLAPAVDPVYSVLPDILYKVKASGGSPAGHITYNGSDYEEDETFRGTYLTAFDSTGATDLSVYEEDFLVDIDDTHKTGHSNEWAFSIGGQTVYDNSGSGTYKPSSYGDVIGAFNDRCHAFSEAWRQTNGLLDGKAMGKFGANDAATSGPVIRAETPPGHRYEGQDVPYVLSGTVNPLIQALDSLPTDCRNSIYHGSSATLVSDGDCDGIVAHYESCQVFKAPYLIKSIAINASDNDRVDVTLHGRLRKNATATTSIVNTAGSRSTYVLDDVEGRSDENTVVAILYKEVDGLDDAERVGDMSANAKDVASGGDWDPSNINGGHLCRFFFQRLMPEVYDDNNNTIETDRDRRAYADLVQYAEFIVRASVGGFADTQQTIDTLQIVAGYCENQLTRDLTMARLLELTEGTTDHDSLPVRRSTDKRGYGTLPAVKMRADTWTELGQSINLLNSSRYGIPVFLETRAITYWQKYDAAIETDGLYQVVPSWSFVTGVTGTIAKNDTGWLQESLPFTESALAYSTLWSDAGGSGVLCYWREVHWRIATHPLILSAVPDILKSFVNDGGLALPALIQPPSRWDSTLVDSSASPLSVATTLVEIGSSVAACDLGQSGILAPAVPPTGDVVTVAAGSGTPGSTQGDAEPYSVATIAINTLAENFIRIPVN